MTPQAKGQPEYGQFSNPKRLPVTGDAQEQASGLPGKLGHYFCTMKPIGHLEKYSYSQSVPTVRWYFSN